MITPTRIVIVNDQELIRCGIRAIVDSQASLQVVGEADNALEALEKLTDLRPDVVLMDAIEPDMDVVEQIRVLCSFNSGHQVPILMVVSSLGDYCVEALRAGVAGLFLKSGGPEELAAALRIVAAGYTLLAPSVSPHLIHRLPVSQATSSLRRKRLAELSSREHEVLRLLAQGHSNTEIAGLLHLGASTVKSHVQRVLRKLRTRDRLQAVIYAYEVGLVRPGELPMYFLDAPWGQTGPAPTPDPELSATSSAARGLLSSAERKGQPAPLVSTGPAGAGTEIVGVIDDVAVDANRGSPSP